MAENTNSENNGVNENENSENLNENSNSTNTENENSNSENANNENTNSKKTVPLSDLISERKKRQALETEITTIKAAQKKLTDDELKKKGEYKSLLDEKEAELESIKPKLQEYETYLNSKRDSIKEKLGDKWLDSFQNLPLTDLEKLAETLVPAKAIPTDGGKGKKTENEIVLTEAEKKRAHEMFEYSTHEEAEEAFAEIKKNRKTKE